MEKLIKIDGKTSFKASNNNDWLFYYRDQFGRDITPMLIPVLNAGVNLAVNAMKASGGDALSADVIRDLDPENITDAIYSLAGFEVVDVINIAWAMAKAADEDIDEPRTWAHGLGRFPVDIIGPAVFELAADCLISSKNLKRLRTAFASLKPTTSA